MKLIKVLAFVLITATPLLSQAQCVMCRTQVVNNVSHGETALAAGLNLGIMYLFFTPYVVLGLVAFLWYRNSKINERTKSLASRITG